MTRPADGTAALSRRAVLRLGLVTTAAPLAGCGFAPLYAHGPDNPTADLPEIYVANIPEGRQGQELRQALQLRLASPTSGAASDYLLSVVLGTSGVGIGIQPDNSSTYTRNSGSASWTLRTAGILPKTLASGSASTLDGYDNIDQEYFASTVEAETSTNRIVANLADEITLQVAEWFKRHHAEALASIEGLRNGDAEAASPGP